MSIIAWGIIFLDENFQNLDKKFSLSFNIIKIAAENEIGIDLGYKVKPYIVERSKNDFQSPTTLVFQLTANALTPNAEALFVGDKIEVFSGLEKEDRGEGLESRMSRLQIFFEKILNLKFIDKVILNIDSGYGENTVFKIEANTIKNFLITLYEKNNNDTPSVTLEILK